VRAPSSGVVAAVRARDGEIVSAGAPLVEVVRAGDVWVVAHVAQQDAARVRATPGLQVRLPGRSDPVVLDASTGAAVVAVGPGIDPVDRTLPVVVSWPDPVDVWPGTFVDTRVLLPEVVDAVAVPAAAVVDDGGVPVVFVMDGGESFFKRRVELGPRDGDLVALSRGVEVGERVVSVGAYEVLLATSAGGIPAHGHQH
ncbi:MAG TPA: HlyD family efflux transporter periplasmic adaptor subunit, partial [Myxococcota bacterium]|nr:HlyD family efflux transporter periplasmic adaptor subunit [Myxococcota bacterium]